MPRTKKLTPLLTPPSSPDLILENGYYRRVRRDALTGEIVRDETRRYIVPSLDGTVKITTKAERWRNQEYQ
jgi:hypothetical protein